MAFHRLHFVETVVPQDMELGGNMKEIIVKKIRCNWCGKYLEENYDVDGGTWFKCPDYEAEPEDHSLLYYDPETGELS